MLCNKRFHAFLNREHYTRNSFVRINTTCEASARTIAKEVFGQAVEVVSCRSDDTDDLFEEEVVEFRNMTPRAYVMETFQMVNDRYDGFFYVSSFAIKLRMFHEVLQG